MTEEEALEIVCEAALRRARKHRISASLATTGAAHEHYLSMARRIDKAIETIDPEFTQKPFSDQTL